MFEAMSLQCLAATTNRIRRRLILKFPPRLTSPLLLLIHIHNSNELNNTCLKISARTGETMIDESKAFGAGLAIASIMLVSGFSMLFVPTYTGFGAVILSLGVMTMVVVLMIKVLVTEIRRWMDFSARIEETVSEILSFKQTIVPGQVFAIGQTENKDKERVKTRAK